MFYGPRINSSVIEDGLNREIGGGDDPTTYMSGVKTEA